MAKTSCEQCVYYIYDEEYESWYCSVNMDEDEIYHYLSSSDYTCPYFRDNDDYFLARKQ